MFVLFVPCERFHIFSYTLFRVYRLLGNSCSLGLRYNLFVGSVPDCLFSFPHLGFTEGMSLLEKLFAILSEDIKKQGQLPYAPKAFILKRNALSRQWIKVAVVSRRFAMLSINEWVSAI